MYIMLLNILSNLWANLTANYYLLSLLSVIRVADLYLWHPWPSPQHILLWSVLLHWSGDPEILDFIILYTS